MPNKHEFIKKPSAVVVHSILAAVCISGLLFLAFERGSKPKDDKIEFIATYQKAIPKEKEALAAAYVEAGMRAGEESPYRINDGALAMYGVLTKGVLRRRIIGSFHHDDSFTPYEQCSPELKALVDAFDVRKP